MEPVVEVKQGKLQGTIRKSVLTGNEYYSFQGIPFAKPPIKDLRFQVSEYFHLFVNKIILPIYDFFTKKKK